MKLIDKIHQQVEDFKGQEFVAPYLGGNKIVIRMNGLVLTLEVKGIFNREMMDSLLVWETPDGKVAIPIRKTTTSQLEEYMKLFPEVRILITKTESWGYHGIMSRTGTGRIRFDGEVPIINLYPFMIGELFDEITCRYDGQTLFYHSTVVTNPGDMIVAAKLRDEIHKREFTYDNEAAVATTHMRPEHEKAFRTAWDHLIIDARDIFENILGNAVSHAGGVMQSYKEDDDTYQVTMEIDGVKQNPVVISKDMEVLSAGICLHNENVFDMQSLVTVLREKQSDDYDDW